MLGCKERALTVYVDGDERVKARQHGAHLGRRRIHRGNICALIHVLRNGRIRHVTTPGRNIITEARFAAARLTITSGRLAPIPHRESIRDR